jgi:uncharacterized protein (TIGR00730 family)
MDVERPKSATPEEHELRMLQGPQKRRLDLMGAVRIFLEIIKGFRALHFLGPCVTVFGSARFPEAAPEYLLARQMGAELGRAGFTVMTGGGPGLMEAANRGARDVGATSVGCNITLPHEQKPNAYLDRFVEFQHFFVRKLMLVKYSYAFVVLPGGFGTLDEFFETLTLVQNGKTKDFPIVLMGRDFWEPLIDFLRKGLLARGTISPGDLTLFAMTDTAAEAIAIIRERALHEFGLTYGPRARPRWYLFERGTNAWRRAWRGRSRESTTS